MAKSGPSNFSHVELDGHEYNGSIRYFSWKEIEEMSSSRTDGIDLKKERSLQASYCRFLQELGMRLKVPQTTIAIAMVYCHRFFLQQSHAKNDRRIIATACMFIATKVVESFRPLRVIIPVAYEIMHKDGTLAALKIKQKEAYEQQKALILLAERVVLVTLAFNFSVALPYRPLVEAIKKFNGAEKLFAQTAWNFVNDVLRTSLCLQYKPQHMAAGAFFLAAKFAKVKLPFEGEFWLQEFNITSQELEEITGQMMELYDVRRPLAIACEGSSGNRQ
ncbi:cyclin-T1-3-like isoform X1 [Phoenix dactylifera]|uniref:Cyclin-T1-3-like isoform X1 n=1 Tax=Phoenix dactylifera TaxID=42345 RepID=A0A8B8J9X0_PHODC|nr:cyclin-T1-3-like isoform X1 [Phoenix dactylifera]